MTGTVDCAGQPKPILSRIVAYVFDIHGRMYGGVFTLKDTPFRKGKPYPLDHFFEPKDRAFVAKLLRETDPDEPWKPFTYYHPPIGREKVAAVFELVWVPSEETDPSSIRWRFETNEVIKVHGE
jgi:hypothetical protein